MDQHEHREVIRRLFTVASMRLEAAMVSAGNGQAADLTADQAKHHSSVIMLTAQELTAIGDAIDLLADRC